MRLRKTPLAFAFAALAALPVMAQDCDYLTQNFELCAAGTPFANGTWEQGGDSATLYLGKVGFEGYEAFSGNEEGGTPTAALDRFLDFYADDRTHEIHTRDTLKTKHLKIARQIETSAYMSDPSELLVFMIAKGGNHMIELSVRAPAETPLAQIEQMSRDYAALVRPRK